MTAIAFTFAVLWTVPLAVAGLDLLALEADLEARIAEPEDDEPVANDNEEG